MKKSYNIFTVLIIVCSLLFFYSNVFAANSLSQEDKRIVMSELHKGIDMLEQVDKEIKAILVLGVDPEIRLGKMLYLAIDLLEQVLVLDDTDSVERLFKVIGEQDNDLLNALMYATRKGYALVVEQLLTRGVEVDKTDSEGFTALMYASGLGHIKVVNVLLKNKAEINRVSSKDKGWISFIHVVIKKLYEENDLKSKSKGKDLSKRFAAKLMLAFEEMIKGGLESAMSNITDKGGMTALIAASATGHVEIVEALIKAGAEVNKTDNNGWTALMLASVVCSSKVMEILVDKGAEIDKVDHDGNTARMLALQNGHKDCAALLEKGKIKEEL